MSEELKSVARAFVSARRAARVLHSYPGNPPVDLSIAYRIQDHAIEIDGRVVAGWKVGKINPPDDVRLGSNRLAGPIFADSVVEARGGLPAMPVFAGGFAAAEAEMLMHVMPGNASASPADDAETLALLDDVCMGIEVASSPYPGINADGPAVTVSDFGNNAGLVLGEAIPGWRERDLCAIVVRTEIDGTVVGETTAATMLDGPLGAVRFLLANLAMRGIDVSAGTWVSTGAITGVHEVAAGQHVRAVFGDAGQVDCSITEAIGRTGE